MMKVYLHEITEQGTELDFGQQDSWAMRAVARADEATQEGITAPRPATAPRPLTGHLTLRKVDEVVVINGNLKTEVSLLCSRCASPFQLACGPSFQSLFCTDPAMAGIAHLDKDKQGRATGKIVGRLKGHARHAHDFAGQDSRDADLDITYLAEEWVELGDVLTEQIQLLVPFQPLCSEECKGICANCGADLNKGRCACSKIQKSNAFSVLKNLRIPAQNS